MTLHGLYFQRQLLQDYKFHVNICDFFLLKLLLTFELSFFTLALSQTLLKETPSMFFSQTLDQHLLPVFH